MLFPVSLNHFLQTLILHGVHSVHFTHFALRVTDIQSDWQTFEKMCLLLVRTRNCKNIHTLWLKDRLIWAFWEVIFYQLFSLSNSSLFQRACISQMIILCFLHICAFRFFTFFLKSLLMSLNKFFY